MTDATTPEGRGELRRIAAEYSTRSDEAGLLSGHVERLLDQIDALTAEVERLKDIVAEHDAELIKRAETAESALVAMRATARKLAEFFRRCTDDASWIGCDVNGADVQDWGVELGLLNKMPFDPAIHGEEGLGYCDPGYDWYVHAPEVRALMEGGDG